MRAKNVVAATMLLALTASHSVPAAEDAAAPGSRSPKMAPDTFAYVSKCGAFWGQVLEEWKLNGGGLKNSLRATREQIARDHKSRFARFVRQTWLAQATAQTSPSLPFGSWPVDSSVTRQVWRNFPQASARVQDECQLADWFAEVLRRDITITEPSGESSLRRLEEVPGSMSWTLDEASTVSSWIAFWLLVRTE